MLRTLTCCTAFSHLSRVCPRATTAPRRGVQFHLVQCPYCGEGFETQLDTSSGSARYVEDCQVCCQPIEFSLEVDDAGALVALSTQRSD